MSNVIRLNNIKHYTGLFSEMPTTLPYGDTYFSTDDQRYFVYNKEGIAREITSGSIEEVGEEVKGNIQGYYSLLSNYYFNGGVATERIITTSEVGQWLDIELTVDALGVFDNRPTAMKEAQTIGHDGTGANGDPIIFKLEGLTTTGTATIRSAFTFDPDEDGGRIESRLLFNRHSGTSPSTDFSIESTSLAMESGADLEYSDTPSVQFFIGDTIDTNGVGDAGRVRIQIKSDVAGTILMREIALFIQS